MKKLVTFTIGLMLTIGDNNSCYASNPVNMGKFPMTMFEEITSKVNSETAQPTQLHFFWTTGRKADDTPNNKSPIKIGGSNKVSKQFFARLEDLLSSSKKNLQNKITARIVVDDLTFNSNKDILERLLNDYNDVFSIMYIDAFKKKLMKRLPSDIWENIASVVFANATGGNPAIASDIYRLIHPIILDENDERITKNNYHLTYMDIDTFSLFEYPGMDSLLSNLLNGLTYKKRKNIKIRFKRAQTNTNNNSQNQFKTAIPTNGANDIINIDINNNFDNFKNYVIDILKAINIEGVAKYNRKYFYTVKHMTDELIKDISETTSYKDGIPYDIVNLTGPAFVSNYKMKHIENFSSLNFNRAKTISQRSWCGTNHYIQQLNLNRAIGRYFIIPPSSPEIDIFEDHNPEQIDKLIKKLERNFMTFLYKLDAANYMKKVLGKDDEELKRLRKDLAENNPMDSNDFICLLDKTTIIYSNKRDDIIINESNFIDDTAKELKKIGIKTKLENLFGFRSLVLNELMKYHETKTKQQKTSNNLTQ